MSIGLWVSAIVMIGSEERRRTWWAGVGRERAGEAEVDDEDQRERRCEAVEAFLDGRHALDLEPVVPQNQRKLAFAGSFGMLEQDWDTDQGSLAGCGRGGSAQPPVSSAAIVTRGTATPGSRSDVVARSRQRQCVAGCDVDTCA